MRHIFTWHNINVVDSRSKYKHAQIIRGPESPCNQQHEQNETYYEPVNVYLLLTCFWHVSLTCLFDMFVWHVCLTCFERWFLQCLGLFCVGFTLALCRVLTCFLKAVETLPRSTAATMASSITDLWATSSARHKKSNICKMHQNTWQILFKDS